MLKLLRRVITAGIFLALTAVSFALAKFLPRLWFSFYPALSVRILSAISAVTGVFPFCLWEILLVLLIIWGIVSLILSVKSKHLLRWLSGVLELVSIFLFVFVGSWGLNHFGPTAAQKLSLDVREYTQEELQEATAYYAAMADSYARNVARNGDGSLQLPSMRELGAQAVSDTKAMPQPMFQSVSGRIKPLLSSRLFSYLGITGIYVDLTAEPCINTETYAASLPFTMCHELSHSCAVAAEDDANFCAYLICEHSEDALFRYSGYYSAFVYCYNALYEKSPDAASSVYRNTGELFRQDLSGSVEYYDRYEGPVRDAASKINDTYLKTFGEEQGVQSYGAAVDLLIAHRLALLTGS